MQDLPDDPEQLKALIRQFCEENERLKAELAELRHRLGLDSTNSHKPPSSDGYKKKHQIVIVTGGGGLAKKYIGLAEPFNPPREFLDNIGIRATRMNAMLLIASLGSSVYERPVQNIEDFEHAISSKKIVVMGVTVPRQTTD